MHVLHSSTCMKNDWTTIKAFMLVLDQILSNFKNAYQNKWAITRSGLDKVELSYINKFKLLFWLHKAINLNFK